MGEEKRKKSMLMHKKLPLFKKDTKFEMLEIKEYFLVTKVNGNDVMIFGV